MTTSTVTPNNAVTPPGALVSLRGAARHLGVSVEAIRRALKAERIKAALRVDANGRQCLDLAVAEREWHANLTDHQLRGRPEMAKATAADAAELAFPADRFSVLQEGPVIVVAVLPRGTPEDGLPDLDETIVLPMLPATARQLAVALLEATGATVRGSR